MEINTQEKKFKVAQPQVCLVKRCTVVDKDYLVSKTSFSKMSII